MKKIKKIRVLIVSSILAIISLGVFAGVVLAAVGDITVLNSTSTDTTISLTWTKATGATNTVIRYSMVSFPATPASGTAAYSGTGSYMTLTGLVPGQTYYFSLWGWDGAIDYSPTALNRAVNTTMTVAQNTTIPYSKPVLPTMVNPSTTGWSWHPLDDIVAYFSDNTSSHGGLGMQSNNVMMFVCAVIASFIGLLAYIKWHNFFGAWVVVMLFVTFFCIIGMMQWIVFVFMIAVGVGVWAIEHNFQ